MARVAREEVFSPDEIAIVHVMNRVVRRCFLLGTDPLTGQNYDHRKVWIEDLFQHFAGCFRKIRGHSTFWGIVLCEPSGEPSGAPHLPPQSFPSRFLGY